MFEINLSPGSRKREKKKKTGGGGLSLKRPRTGSGVDRTMLFMLVAWIGAILVGAWLFMGIRSERADLEVALDQAVADSARLAEVIANQESLRARQDTIAQKLSMIQEIDAGRYIWPHVMDEVSRALPPYTWLTGIEQVSGGPTPRFRVIGRAGSLPALTRLMDGLEASPFVRTVELISSEQGQVGSDPNKIVNNFVLEGTYEVPPLEVVETVPLFEEGQLDTVTVEASDGTGTS